MVGKSHKQHKATQEHTQLNKIFFFHFLGIFILGLNPEEELWI